MTKNNSVQQISLWGNFIKIGKKIITSIRKQLRDFSSSYPNTAQSIQLTFVYFFAVIVVNILILMRI